MLVTVLVGMVLFFILALVIWRHHKQVVSVWLHH
jgi:hypothetical protein